MQNVRTCYSVKAFNKGFIISLLPHFLLVWVFGALTESLMGISGLFSYQTEALLLSLITLYGKL